MIELGPTMVLLLDSADEEIPAGTPVGTLILVKV